MTTILALIFFIFGLIIGSFLNVVIARFNSSKSLGGRSACMSCESTLKWYDLVPLFSFLALKGRCRTCKTRISFMYPAVEFLTGIIFTTLFLKFSALGGSRLWWTEFPAYRCSNFCRYIRILRRRVLIASRDSCIRYPT